MEISDEQIVCQAGITRTVRFTASTRRLYAYTRNAELRLYAKTLRWIVAEYPRCVNNNPANVTNFTLSVQCENFKHCFCSVKLFTLRHNALRHAVDKP